MFYYVKWKNYEDKENSWEPKKNFLPGLIEEFEMGLKETSIKKNKTLIKKHKHQSVKTKEETNEVGGNKEKIPLKSDKNQDDKPKKILSCINPSEKDFNKRLFKICWRRRKDGFSPQNSILSADEIKVRFGLQTLLEYYEENFKVKV